MVLKHNQVLRIMILTLQVGQATLDSVGGWSWNSNAQQVLWLCGDCYVMNVVASGGCSAWWLFFSNVAFLLDVAFSGFDGIDSYAFGICCGISVGNHLSHLNGIQTFNANWSESNISLWTKVDGWRFELVLFFRGRAEPKNLRGYWTSKMFRWNFFLL